MLVVELLVDVEAVLLLLLVVVGGFAEDEDEAIVDFLDNKDLAVFIASNELWPLELSAKNKANVALSSNLVCILFLLLFKKIFYYI